MKLIIRNHKPKAGKYNNENHGKLLKIFKILEADSLGFVQEYWSETFEPIPNTKDWLLELNTEPEWHKLEKILALKNVEEFNA
tara:strand:+ start:298 stop:546 length:249 start_codon:yes stop_codon:yes gene_type:complete